MTSLYKIALTPPKQERLMERCMASLEYLAEAKVRQRVINHQREGPEEGLFCPKPRRAPNGIQRPSARLCSYTPTQAEMEAKNELMDILLTKCTHSKADQGNANGSIPYFVGSPPCRASNPLIHDTLFTTHRKNNNSNTTTPPLKHRFGSPIKKKPLCLSYISDPSVRIEGFVATSSSDNTNNRNRDVLTLA